MSGRLHEAYFIVKTGNRHPLGSVCGTDYPGRPSYLNDRKTVVVDEINCCLSPTTVKGIVEYSHNDFKEHHTISPYRGYNEGRYGAIRFVKLIEDR